MAQAPPPTPQSHLIDVRSPIEFASGFLISDIAPTINIEYTSISSLPEMYAARGIDVNKNDHITLYCRSGRRSDIALQTLSNMGYVNVRDIGGFEEARKVLDRETVGRQLDREMGVEKRVGIEGVGGMRGLKEGNGVGGGGGDEKRHVRTRSFGALLEGLKALEE